MPDDRYYVGTCFCQCHLPRRAAGEATSLDDLHDWVHDQIVEDQVLWEHTINSIVAFMSTGETSHLLDRGSGPLDTLRQMVALVEGRAD